MDTRYDGGTVEAVEGWKMWRVGFEEGGIGWLTSVVCFVKKLSSVLAVRQASEQDR
jgi:hypothetical protein